MAKYRKHNITDILGGALVYALFLSPGVFAYWLARPGLSVRESLIAAAIIYALFAFFCVIAGTPGVGARPGKIVYSPKDPRYFLYSGH